MRNFCLKVLVNSAVYSGIVPGTILIGFVKSSAHCTRSRNSGHFDISFYSVFELIARWTMDFSLDANFISLRLIKRHNRSMTWEIRMKGTKLLLK